ncbi:MAG: RNA polymerase sigma factor, partial [Chthoniobacterales bacterium]
MKLSSLAVEPSPLFLNMSDHEPGPPGRTPEDAEDIRLMGLASAGDMAAFEQLVERHQRLVVGTVGRMLGTNSDAEDIAQQVFVRVWKNLKRYEPRAKFTTWLLKITRNLVFNELRRRSRHPAVPLQSETDEEERPLKDDHAVSPDATLLEHELQEAVDAAIAQLPETQRMAVILRRYEELSYEEIAEALDQSVSAVKSLLFRAQTELRESLKRYL